MAAPLIAALPVPPSRSSPSNFSERADAFLGALPNFQSQANALASWLDTTSSSAVTAAQAARDLALSYRNTASTHATNAGTAKTAAETARTQAQTAATTATTKAGEASSSATAAAGSAGAASTSAGAASGSATAAATSEGKAKTSETNAKTSETKAKTSETNAKTSETNAAGSAATANTRATAAETARAAAVVAEGNAKTSETNAKTSETKAKTSETNAGTSRTQAQEALSDFNAKWYGSRTTAPTGTIAEGALYFNTTTGGLHIRKGGTWVGAVVASFDELWALIKNSDGHNSGLDADTVDGRHLSQLVDMLTTVQQNLEGQLKVTDGLYIRARVAGSNLNSIMFEDETAAERGRIGWDRASNSLNMYVPRGGGGINNLQIMADGRLLHNGQRVATTSDLDLSGVAVIEINKGGSGNRNAILDFHAQDGVDYSARIIREPGENGHMVISNSRGTGDLTLANGANSIKFNAGEVFKNGVPLQNRNEIATNAVGIGAIIFARSTAAVGNDVQVAGSSLTVAGVSSSGALLVGSYTPPGTWKCRGSCPANGASMFQRVA